MREQRMEEKENRNNGKTRLYEEPEVTVIILPQSDVITTSGGGNNGNSGTNSWFNKDATDNFSYSDRCQ